MSSVRAGILDAVEDIGMGNYGPLSPNAARYSIPSALHSDSSDSEDEHVPLGQLILGMANMYTLGNLRKIFASLPRGLTR